MASLRDTQRMDRASSEARMVTDVKPAPKRAKKAPKKAVTASASLLQVVCTDGQFCMQTHKPGLCKGQKRGQTEPGRVDATNSTPAQKAKVAVNGLGEAIARAQAIAAVEGKRNPKLAAAARKAIGAYKKALAPHQQALKDAARENDRAKREGVQDTRQQDTLDKRAARKKESLKKHAQAIINRRKAKAAEDAKLKKMSPKQRTAYRKNKAAAARKQREQQENKVIRQASS